MTESVVFIENGYPNGLLFLHPCDIVPSEMGDAQHKTWLLEGVEAWNARRQSEDFVPDFAGEDIVEAFGQAGPVEVVNGIPRIPLARINLSSANLSGVNFTGVNLGGANFTRAHGHRVNFTKANLHKANLTQAYFPWSIFVEADLTAVDFTDADLRYANLAKAEVESSMISKSRNLLGTKVWLADLPFVVGVSTETGDFAPGQMNDVGDFIKDILKTKDIYGENMARIDLYFRGEKRDYQKTETHKGASKGGLVPSLMRGNYTGRNTMLRDLIARRPADFTHANSALDHWMIAQHHRLPTRFLDITRDPLVGLFFACEEHELEDGYVDGYVHVFVVDKSLIRPFDSDAVSVIMNFARLSYIDQRALLGKHFMSFLDDEENPYPEAMRRLYQLIRQEKPYFDHRIDIADFYRVLVVEPQQSTERIRAQRGAFLISALHEQFEPDEIRSKNPNIPVYAHHRLPVPHEHKRDMREQLAMLNITHETLFPGLESSAEAVRDSYKLKA